MKKSHLVIIVVAVLGGALLFYWYEWRPLSIKKACEEVATKLTAGFGSIGSSNSYEMEFERCLNRYGL